ncbi:MAG: sigma-54 dependent transcriptional regulator [Bacteroidales bacterium]|nr:sigma-54 dependent transcriptional regulator [Bacteroidales bacterium]
MKILVIDDDPAIRQSLQLVLRRSGYECILASNPTQAIEAVRTTEPDLALMDMNFTASVSGEEGLELLRRTKVLAPDMPVILITAWGSIPLAVEGMRLGAADFVTKPWVNAELLRRISTILSLKTPQAQKAPTDDFDRSGIIGNNEELQAVLAMAARVAPTDASVLILGENGTGKELIAEAIHRNSQRRDKPFVKVNLGGVSQSLFESEMFGHKKGAFTGAIADRVGRFELADGGTIFLDEIGELDLGSQVKLLRVLQEHTFEPLGDSRTRRTDVRVICATNASLEQMVKEKTFREDLFYRINLITLTLPSLRRRSDDIPALVDYFAGKASARIGRKAPRFTAAALRRLSALPFPGNVRELSNLVERILILSAGPVIDEADLAPCLPVAQPQNDQSLESIENQRILDAMRRSGDNVTKAAALLGLSRQALYRRLQKMNN